MFELNWTNGSIHTLGVYMDGKEGNHYLLNFKKRLKNMENLLASWKSRKLSLKGKVTVLNTLALSPLLYLASVIHVPEQVYKEVKSLMLDFLWDGKPSKVAYDILIQKTCDGGLKLVDFETKVRTLKLAWVQRLCNLSQANWKAAPLFLLDTKDFNLYFKCNQETIKNLPSKFYSEVQSSWAKLQELPNIPPNSVIRNQTIWNNRYITINNRLYAWRIWENADIEYISDIVDGNGQLLGHVTFLLSLIYAVIFSKPFK